MNIGERISYGLLLGSCKVAGLLPDWLLYNILGCFIRFILYRVVHYRLKVVRNNLRRSFPEKDEAELRRIERGFYRTLSDVFIDTVKLASISRTRILERMRYRNIDQINRETEGRSWISAMSHFGSWEMTINFKMCQPGHDVLAVYRPLHSKAFDRYYDYARSRFGTRPVPMNDVYKEIVRARRPGAVPVAVALIADQTPPRHEIKYWYRFLGQDTPFFSGVEKMGLRFGIPVYFLHIRAVSRRHYEGEFIRIYDGSEAVGEYEITKRYITRLEAMIRESPELWMWSHRRWKHKMEDWHTWR